MALNLVVHILTNRLHRVNDARLFRYMLQNIRQNAIQNVHQFLSLCLYILMYSYCYVYSVMYMFSSYQLAFFGYPD